MRSLGPTPCILTVIGTRPEAIKLAPVILRLREAGDARAAVCLTAQHRELVDDVLELFDVTPDFDLDLMTARQTPTDVASRALAGLGSILDRRRPDWVVVQGDTTSTMAAAIASLHAGCRVAHVEAGLRSHDLRHPWPEEANRRIVDVLADLHFAPTPRARENLLREGVADDRIVVTGNTGIDALRLALESGRRTQAARPVWTEKRIVLVTLHRRETLGSMIGPVCRALRELATEFAATVEFVWPVHPNPQVRGVVRRLLEDVDGMTLLEPLNYLDLVRLLEDSYLVLTDSGGLQEEAPTLGKPVLVLRETTERTEAVDAGAAELVGRTAEAVVPAVARLLEDRATYARMAVPRALFGDGHAAERIVSALRSWDQPTRAPVQRARPLAATGVVFSPRTR